MKTSHAVAFNRRLKARRAAPTVIAAMLLFFLPLRVRVGVYSGVYPSPGAGGSGPTARLDVGPNTTGFVSHGIWVSGYRSSPGTVPIASYLFTFSDGGTSNQTQLIGGANVPIPFAVHHYTGTGIYLLTLKVTDVNGLFNSVTTFITVNPLPGPTVTVNPGADVIAALNGAAANAKIQINAGTYIASGTWACKAGQMVWSNGGVVVIDGNNSITRFVVNNTAGATGIYIDGLEIRNFVGDNADGFTKMVVLTTSTNGAIIKNCNIHDNSGGVNLYNTTNLVLDNNRIHHNSVYAFSGAGGNPSNLTLMGNQWDNNYTDRALSLTQFHYPNINDGVAKVAQVTSATVIGNNSHDNNGFGLWHDGQNFNCLVAINTFTNNAYGGFFNEITQGSGGNLYGSGFSTLVLFNIFKDNHETTNALYTQHPNAPNGGSLTPPPTSTAWTSSGMLWEYNIIDGGKYADDGSGATDGVIMDYSPRFVFGINMVCKDNTVRNNDIRVGSNRRLIGITHNYGSASPSLPTGIVSDNNHLYADNITTQLLFALPSTLSASTINTLAQWRAAGFDNASTTHTYASWPH